MGHWYSSFWRLRQTWSDHLEPHGGAERRFVCLRMYRLWRKFDLDTTYMNFALMIIREVGNGEAN
jgi:hypothetical protein